MLLFIKFIYHLWNVFSASLHYNRHKAVNSTPHTLSSYPSFWRLVSFITETKNLRESWGSLTSWHSSCPHAINLPKEKLLYVPPLSSVHFTAYSNNNIITQNTLFSDISLYIPIQHSDLFFFVYFVITFSIYVWFSVLHFDYSIFIALNLHCYNSIFVLFTHVRMDLLELPIIQSD